jgi:hypothetical protein
MYMYVLHVPYTNNKIPYVYRGFYYTKDIYYILISDVSILSSGTGVPDICESGIYSVGATIASTFFSTNS